MNKLLPLTALSLIVNVILGLSLVRDEPTNTPQAHHSLDPQQVEVTHNTPAHSSTRPYSKDINRESNLAPTTNSNFDSKLFRQNLQSARNLWAGERITKLQAIYADWALHDLEAARKALEEEGLSIIPKREIVLAMTRSLAEHGYFEDVTQLWENSTNIDFDYMYLFQSLSDDEFIAGNRTFQSWMENDSVPNVVQTYFASRWAEIDTKATLDWALNLKDPKEQGRTLGYAIKQVIAYEGYEEALRVIAELPDDSQIDSALKYVSRGIRDFEAASNLIQSMDDSKARDYTRERMVKLGARQGNIQESITFAKAIENDQVYNKTISILYSRIALEKSFEEAISHIEKDRRLSPAKRAALLAEYSVKAQENSLNAKEN